MDNSTKDNKIHNLSKKLFGKELSHELKKYSFLKKIFVKMTLSRKQKISLKEYNIEYQKHLNSEKSDFNPENSFEVKELNLWYLNGKKHALKNISIDIKKNKVTTLIGPSGCGKSTFLRCLNRMNDLIEGITIEGDIYFDKKHINSPMFDSSDLKIQVGLVFQKPTPFSMSIYDNIAFAPKLHGIKDKKELNRIIEESLKNAALWDDVKDELDKSGLDLSGGQQQRLCLARTLALSPKVILMDEPTSALDPIATGKIEELILKLKENYTIIIVTHSMAQAQRISDETVFFYKGEIIEAGPTKQIFTKPKEKLTRDYISGKI